MNGLPESWLEVGFCQLPSSPFPTQENLFSLIIVNLWLLKSKAQKLTAIEA